MEYDKIKRESELLTILGQPTRLKILNFLANGEKCVCEITPAMEEDPSVISRHLTKMRDVGILESRREGISVYYWINDTKIFSILELADQIIHDIAKKRFETFSLPD